MTDIHCGCLQAAVFSGLNYQQISTAWVEACLCGYVYARVSQVILCGIGLPYDDMRLYAP